MRCPLTKYYAGSSPHARGTLLGGGWHRLCSTVHPRMRGERLFQAVSIVSGGGSSPHARGTQGGNYFYGTGRRFIPACAGNAPSLIPDHPAWTVHPRMRGERRIDQDMIHAHFGSSPHARGTLNGVLDPQIPLRFIPACAGNARPCYDIRSRVPVHPRMRGERQPISSLKLLFFGSSPHARGTLNSVVDPLLIPRFIPACAGNAFTPAVHQKFVTVHPRMRGERLAALPCAGIFTGSSPHARGTHPGMGVSQLQDRFIPACAGNADERKMTLEGSPVHPRMRGERVPFLAAMRSNTGSSPHARGTRRTLSARRSTMRFIPACAGNALVPSAWDSITAVHPRMRGERGTGPATLAL